MAIDVQWQDERGAVLMRYEGTPIDLLLIELANPNSGCLRFIEPWGDTTFNSAQVASLESELRAVDARGAAAEQARALLDFLAQVPDRTHRYLKFIGD